MKSILHISVFTIIGALGSAINFFLMPVLSHYLTPVDYGYTALINTYVTILIPFLSLLSYSIISVEYFKMKDKKEFASLFSSIVFIPVIPAIIFGVLFTLGFPYIHTALELPGKIWIAPVSTLTGLFIIYAEIASSLLVMKKDVKLFAVFSISKIVVETVLTVLFVIHWDMGWQGRIYSWVITSLVFAVFALVIFYRWQYIFSPVKKQFIRAGLIYGYPLIAHEVGKFVVNQSDRLFIAKMVSIGEAGIYNVGYTVGSAMLIGVGALSNYFAPIVMGLLSGEDKLYKEHLVMIAVKFFVFLITAFVLVNIASQVLFRYFISPVYYEGIHFVPWVSLSYFFWGIYLVFAPYLYYFHKTKVLGLFSVVNVLLNLGLNYIMIGHFGAIGGAYATCISFFVLTLLIVIYTNSIIKLPWLDAFKKNNE